jgi:FkbM family methyltransferase
MADDRIDFDGFSVRIDLDRWPAKIVRALLRRHYEKNERRLVKRLLGPGDTVIELGSAIGVVAMAAANIVPATRIFCFDANPDMVDEAKANFAHNNAAISVANTILTADDTAREAKTATFFKTPYFLSSSLLRHRKDMVPVDVPLESLSDAIRDNGANTLIIDIEGGEFELLAAANLEQIEKLSLELHIAHGGLASCHELIAGLARQGLNLDPVHTSENVFVFTRAPALPHSVAFVSAYLESLDHDDRGDQPAALASIDAAIAACADNSFAHSHRAALLTYLGDTDGALVAATTAARRDDGNADNFEQIADLHTRLDHGEEAAVAYAKAIDRDAFRPLFHAGLGSGEARRGNTDAALRAFRSAAAMVPQSACTLAALRAVGLRQDKHDKDRSDQTLPAIDDTAGWAATRRLAEILMTRFRFIDAGTSLHHATELFPDALPVHMALAQLTATPRDIREAFGI